MANALIYNHTLKELILDGNVLGRPGTQSMVASIQRAAGDSRTLAISFNNCDCDKEDRSVFNPASPGGDWIVDLSEPYGRMVVEECIFLATHKRGCSITKISLNSTSLKLVHSQPIHAKSKFNEFDFRRLSKAFANSMSEDGGHRECCTIMQDLTSMFNFFIQKDLISNIVKQIQSNWNLELAKGTVIMDDLADVLIFELFVALFQIADADGSGLVSHEELKDIMRLLGIYLSEDEMQRLMNDFDIDNSGQVSIDEFSNAMVAEFCQTSIPKGELLEATTNRPWEIPDSGKVSLTMNYKVEKPGVFIFLIIPIQQISLQILTFTLHILLIFLFQIFNVLRQEGMTATIYSLRNAKSLEQRNTIFKQIVSSPYFFLNSSHAQMLFSELSNGTDSSIDLIAEILPQIVNETHACIFIDSNLNDLGKLALRVRLGNMYNAYIGNPTGHYRFDLRNSLQRIMAKKMSAVSVSEAAYCEQLVRIS